MAAAILASLPPCAAAQDGPIAQACTQPGPPPPLPRVSAPDYQVARFNRRIEEHNAATHGYIACLERREQKAPPILPATSTGNLPAGFYPASPCKRPDASGLGRKPDRGDARAIAIYNEKARTHYRATETFNVCIHDYVAKAMRDAQEIRAAVAAANMSENND